MGRRRHVRAPRAIASALVIRFAHLERLRASAAGRYLERIMTPATQGVPLAGALVMAVGAWQRSWLLVIAGLLVVAAAWARGLTDRIG